MTTILVAAIVLIAIIGLGFALKKKSGQRPGQAPNKTQAKPESPAPAPSPEKDFTKILDTLLTLNLLIRKDPAISRDAVEKIETIIDDLKTVVPAMMERYPGETLTYELKKIGETHLLRVVKEFLDLSPDSRKAQSAVFSDTVQNLHDVVHRSAQIVEKNETAEFKTMANFLAGKFS